MLRVAATCLFFVPVLAQDESRCCRCASVTTVDNAASCIVNCGYAVWRGAYNATALRSFEDAFSRWFNDRSPATAADATRTMPPLADYLSYNEHGMLRGRRAHIMLPQHIPNENLLFNEAIFASHFAALEQLGFRGYSTLLNFAGVIHAGEFAYDQSWHSDAPMEDGIKVQVPLTDVTDKMGPIEIAPTKDAKGCSIIRATTSLGDAVIYRHKTRHRGTGNKMRNGVNRTALDVSYQLTEVVAADNFMHKSKFPLAAFKAMRTYRHRTAKQCRRKGWPCASREEVDAVSRREGSPYSGPKADLPVRKDGFVGAYQGAGRGNGTWMDPNGSIFVGECEDGMFQGRGWYTFSNGDKYSGDFSHGMKHGRGLYEFANGETYKGEFFNNERHGEAQIRSSDGDYFEGIVKHEQFHKGVMRKSNGVVMEGEFKEGKLNGECKITQQNGFRYEGPCKDGNILGPGRLVDPQGQIQFQGEWRNNMPHRPPGAELGTPTPTGSTAKKRGKKKSKKKRRSMNEKTGTFATEDLL